MTFFLRFHTKDAFMFTIIGVGRVKLRHFYSGFVTIMSLLKTNVCLLCLPFEEEAMFACVGRISVMCRMTDWSCLL